MSDEVLVFCPMAPTMPRLWGATVQSILRMTHSMPVSFVFREGDNPFTGEEEGEQPLAPTRTAQQKREMGYRNITHNYNWAREQVLAGEYAALMTVEADMIVPPDALERLWATGADIAYGLYCWRHGRREWSAYSEVSERYGKSISEDEIAAKKAWGQVVKVAGVGMGCTLIKRHVLARLDFRLDEDDPAAVCCDWMLALDAQAEGFTQACDLGVVCGHQTMTPYPQVIYPDPLALGMYRVEPLVGKFAARRTVSVGLGQTDEIVFQGSPTSETTRSAQNGVSSWGSLPDTAAQAPQQEGNN